MHEDPEDILHEHFGGGGGAANLIAEDIEGIEVFTLTSVGIDIGSSTSHVVFSRLTLRREGAALSAHFAVTDREILYQSEIILTPYLHGTQIDAGRLKAFIDSAYEEAGFTPDQIDTGAVVLTGEALTKENARPILELFAAQAGKFICASAGPNHEALLAAHGSGAVDLSKGAGSTILNIDVGGGTTKLSLVRNGEVVDTAAINVGARLIAFDEQSRLTRIEEPARAIFRKLGYRLDVGDRISQDQQERIAAELSALLLEAVQAAPRSPLGAEFQVTPPLSGYSGIDDVAHVVVSGGVSEYVYGHDTVSYGDLGALLGRGIRDGLERLGRLGLLQPPLAGIRATVIGAGEYTVQASGTTSYISDASVLPVFGLRVVRPASVPTGELAGAIARALEKYDLRHYTAGLALALSITEPPTYGMLRAMAQDILAAVRGTDSPEAPVFLLLDMDVAKSLGGILKEELALAPELVVIDGIDVGDLDFVDIGRPMGVSEVLPVTVKSLMFPSRRGDSAKQLWTPA